MYKKCHIQPSQSYRLLPICSLIMFLHLRLLFRPFPTFHKFSLSFIPSSPASAVCLTLSTCAPYCFPPATVPLILCRIAHESSKQITLQNVLIPWYEYSILQQSQ